MTSVRQRPSSRHNGWISLRLPSPPVSLSCRVPGAGTTLRPARWWSRSTYPLAILRALPGSSTSSLGTTASSPLDRGVLRHEGTAQDRVGGRCRCTWPISLWRRCESTSRVWIDQPPSWAFNSPWRATCRWPTGSQVHRRSPGWASPSCRCLRRVSAPRRHGNNCICTEAGTSMFCAATTQWSGIGSDAHRDRCRSLWQMFHEVWHPRAWLSLRLHCCRDPCGAIRL